MNTLKAHLKSLGLFLIIVLMVVSLFAYVHFVLPIYPIAGVAVLFSPCLGFVYFVLYKMSKDEL